MCVCLWCTCVGGDVLATPNPVPCTNLSSCGPRGGTSSPGPDAAGAASTTPVRPWPALAANVAGRRCWPWRRRTATPSDPWSRWIRPTASGPAPAFAGTRSPSSPSGASPLRGRRVEGKGIVSKSLFSFFIRKLFYIFKDFFFLIFAPLALIYLISS